MRTIAHEMRFFAAKMPHSTSGASGVRRSHLNEFYARAAVAADDFVETVYLPALAA
jgi:hypothetical protein